MKKITSSAMSKLGLANKAQEYVVEIKTESTDPPEFDFNDHEHNYCINDYSTRASKHFIYMNEKNIPQFETLENVEPSLVLLTYVPKKITDVNEPANVDEEVQNEVGNPVQIYGANDLVQNVFVHNGEVELVNSEMSEDAVEDIKDQEDDTQQLKDSSVTENHIIHKVNGTEVWIMVEGAAKGDTESNADETEMKDCTDDETLVYEKHTVPVVFEDSSEPLVYEERLEAPVYEERSEPLVFEESCEGDKTEWILQKPKAKSLTAQQRKTVSRKTLLCKNKESIDFDGATKKVQKRSWVWKYFSKQGDVIYQCSLCQSNLSIRGCNTNNMNRHIRTKHFSIYNMEVEPKPLVISESENNEKKDGEEVADCHTQKSVSNSAEDDGSLFKQRFRSWVWLLFDQESPTVARCKICNRKITHGGTATGNLNRHIKLLHKEVYVDVCSSEKRNRRTGQSETFTENENNTVDIIDVNSFEEAWNNFQWKELARRKALCEQ